jgi:hypothetical protein
MTHWRSLQFRGVPWPDGGGSPVRLERVGAATPALSPYMKTLTHEVLNFKTLDVRSFS